MADNTPIEWTDATWNTVGGCTRVHEGCTNCYAEIMAARFSKPGQWGEGLARIVTRPDGSKDHRWTGKIRFNTHALTQPLRWKRPRRIFVNSTADTFHDGVTDDQLDQIFAIMALCPQHTFQVLTKRPERAAQYLSAARARLMEFICDGVVDSELPVLLSCPPAMVPPPDLVASGLPVIDLTAWPLPNVWIGTSISDQASADAMIPHLLNTPAAVHFLSVEPMLGPVDIEQWMHDSHCWEFPGTCICLEPREVHIEWVICGGESGPGARPMHPDWARSLRDQCHAAGVSFFFKQWGEWAPCIGKPVTHRWRKNGSFEAFDGGPTYPGEQGAARIGKRAAGRLMDGREWNEMPEVSHA